MGETVAFLSGKGGTGKTSVCAGVAAALSIQQGTTPAETEIALIQEKLREQGAVVSRADEGKKADKAAECEEEE